MDFPTAWTIARATPVADHNPCCSYAQTDGGLLCDCRVLTEHPAYLADYGPAGADMHLRPAKNPQRGERADERNHQTPGDDTAGGKPATTPLPVQIDRAARFILTHGENAAAAGEPTLEIGIEMVGHIASLLQEAAAELRSWESTRGQWTGCT